MHLSQYTLTPQEHDALFREYDEGALSPDIIEKNALMRIRELCVGLSDALDRFASADADAPILLIRGLPEKTLGDIATPSDRRNPAQADRRTEANLRLCASMIGASIRAAEGEKFPFDTPFHHVVPQQDHADTPAVNNGAGDFPFHQDRIFLEHTPHLHMLAGVRLGNDPCPTAFMDTRPILRALPHEMLDALRVREYEDPHTGTLVPILRDAGAGEYIGADLQPGWMLPITERAERALTHLRRLSLEHAAEDAISVLIGPGDVLIHDHRRLMHGRERFAPDFSNHRNLRWMIRSHAMRPDHA